MIVDYISIVNKVYDTIVENNLFNPLSAQNLRLVNRVERTKKVPGQPLPAITISIDQSADQWRTIGYTPWNAIRIEMKIYCSLPAKPTARLLTDLGLSKITTDWESEQEMYYITSKLMEWFRGDETEAGVARRSLGLEAVEGMDLRIPTLSTFFNRIAVGNLELKVARIIADFTHGQINI